MSRRIPMETFDHRRRRRRRRSSRGLRVSGRAMLAVLLALAIAGAATWWWYTRPASVAITAWPDDAVITFEDIDYFGDLALEDLEPGAYRVVVERKGYESLETTVDLPRWKLTELSYTLAPLPIDFSAISNPSRVSYRIEVSDGTVLVGETPFVGTLPAGKTMLTLSLPGYNEYRRDLTLDETTDLTFWMDPEGQLVHCLNVFDCGPAPKAATFTPDGSEVWVTLLAGPPSVQIFEPLSGELLAELTLGEDGAVEVVFSADGTKAYVSQMETAFVYEIDVRTREVLRTLDTESSWSKMLAFGPHEKRLFVANWTADDVSEIDLESGEMIRRRHTVDTPRGLYVTEDGDHLYVAGFGTGVIQRIGLSDGTRETVYSGGGAIRHFAVDEERHLLFASDMAKDEIVMLDLRTDEVTHFADTDEKPNTIALSPDGTVLFVSCRGANNAISYYLPGPEWGSVLLLDAQTGEPLDAIVGGNQPTALDVSADGTRLVFGDFLDDRLRYYEIPAYETLAAGEGGLYGAHTAMLVK